MRKIMNSVNLRSKLASYKSKLNKNTRLKKKKKHCDGVTKKSQNLTEESSFGFRF